MSAICTLFEGHYHFGVAALVNSLHYHGYNGPVYAGYKGSLPAWAQAVQDSSAFNWPGAKTLLVGDGLQLHLLPIQTASHLTNYKPDFMLSLLAGPAKKIDALFYFDPDIQVTTAWAFFSEWVSCGVALSEDINSPLPLNHPRRVAWRRYFGKHSIQLSFKDPIYVNGGFIGLSKVNFGFLHQWKTMQDTMAPLIGGLDRSIFSAPKVSQGDQEAFDPFGRTDQDALNAAIEAWDGAYSFIGKEAMAFAQGTSIMPHALGSPKPWKSNIILNALKGYQLRVADRSYWQYANLNIITHTALRLKVSRLLIKIAAIIGRFYSRGDL